MFIKVLSIILVSSVSYAAYQPGGLTNTELRASPVPVSQGTAGVSAWLVDGSAVTQPVSAASLPLPSGASTEATLSAMSAKLPAALGQTTSAASMSVTLASDQTSIPVVSESPINTGSFAQITNLVATAQTFTAPANAIGFKIQAPSTNTENIAFSIGATATITAGILMEPGRSEDFDTGSNISVIATSAATQTVTVIWKVKP